MSWASCFYTPGVSRIIQKSFGFDLLFFWASESAVVNRACSLDPSGFHPDATVLRPVSVFQQTMDQRRHPLDRCSKMMLHPDPCAVHGRQAFSNVTGHNIALPTLFQSSFVPCDVSVHRSLFGACPVRVRAPVVHTHRNPRADCAQGACHKKMMCRQPLPGIQGSEGPGYS